MTVTLKPLETPVYQRAAKKVIDKINQMRPVTIDGTNRRIEFKIQPRKQKNHNEILAVFPNSDVRM